MAMNISGHIYTSGNVPTFAAELPGDIHYGMQGPRGPKGDDYVLTDADRAEIAEMAAGLVEVPGSGGNVDLTGVLRYTEQSLTDEQQAQARKNIGVDTYIEEVILGGEW